MFGIKKYLLKLGNWMVISKQLLELNQNQTKTKNIAKTTLSEKFWTYMDMFGIKMYILKLWNLTVTLKQLLESKQNKAQPNQTQ